MTSIAVLSDVHANWFALEKIINTQEFLECDLFLFCGDAVGYYFQAERVITYLKNKIDHGVKGNHDEYLQRFLENKTADINRYTQKYGSGLNRAIETISESNFQWLIDLPQEIELKIESRSIYVSHSAPTKKNCYIYKDSPHELIRQIYNLNYECVIFGHSHYQFCLSKDKQLIVNPGSVGQPRDKGGYADWAILKVDKDGINVQLRKTTYDVSSLIKDAKLYDPENKYLTEVLLRK